MLKVAVDLPAGDGYDVNTEVNKYIKEWQLTFADLTEKWNLKFTATATTAAAAAAAPSYSVTTVDDRANLQVVSLLVKDVVSLSKRRRQQRSDLSSSMASSSVNNLSECSSVAEDADAVDCFDDSFVAIMADFTSIAEVCCCCFCCFPAVCCFTRELRQ